MYAYALSIKQSNLILVPDLTNEFDLSIQNRSFLKIGQNRFLFLSSLKRIIISQTAIYLRSSNDRLRSNMELKPRLKSY